MPNIFISYRRAESEAVAGRIYDYLEQAFGAEAIFKDVFDIPPGHDFRTVIRQRVEWCDILLVIIGRQYGSILDEDGQRRLENDTDYVRFEVSTALADERVLVIPVLVNGARMPTLGELPDDMDDLTYLNAVQVRNDPDFKNDMHRLTNYLRGVRQTTAPTTPTPKPEPRSKFEEDLAEATNLRPPRRIDANTGQGGRRGIFAVGGGVLVLIIIGMVIALSGALNGDDESPASPPADVGDNAAVTNPTDGNVTRISGPSALSGDKESYAITYSQVDVEIYGISAANTSNDWDVVFNVEYPTELYIADNSENAIALSLDQSWADEVVENGARSDNMPAGDSIYGIRIQVDPSMGLEYLPTFYDEVLYSQWIDAPSRRDDNAGEPHSILVNDEAGYGFISYLDDRRVQWESFSYMVNGVGVIVDVMTNDVDGYRTVTDTILQSLEIAPRLQAPNAPVLDTATEVVLDDGAVVGMSYPQGWLVRTWGDVFWGTVALTSNSQILAASNNTDDVRYAMFDDPEDYGGHVLVVSIGLPAAYSMEDTSLETATMVGILKVDPAPWQEWMPENQMFTAAYVRVVQEQTELFEIEYYFVLNDTYIGIARGLSNDNPAVAKVTFDHVLASLVLFNGEQPQSQSGFDDMSSDDNVDDDNDSSDDDDDDLAFD